MGVRLDLSGGRILPELDASEGGLSLVERDARGLGHAGKTGGVHV